MATESMTPESLRMLTQWLDVPLTPGKEKDLTAWLASDPDNQAKWDRWAEFNASAKRLQIIPSEVAPEWELLRDEIGFTHSARRRSKRHSSSLKKRSIMRMPLVVAILSTVVFATFLLILYLIKSSSKF